MAWDILIEQKLTKRGKLYKVCDTILGNTDMRKFFAIR